VPKGPQWKSFGIPAGPGFPRNGPALPARPLPAFSLNQPGAAAPDPTPPVRCAAMDLRRLHAGEWLAAVSGVALLASLFLPWYGTKGYGTGGVCIGRYDDVIRGVVTCANPSGWESLAAIDVLLAFVAASGVLLAVVTAAQPVPALPIAVSALVSLIGLAGVVLVLLRALDLPDWASDREWGIWLGLAGAIGIIAGALLAMREETLPGAAPVEIEAIPAPRP
jgi:hypothetical protein